MSKLIKVARESVRGGLFLFTGNFLSTLISAVAVIIVARLLGPVNYGLYSISLIVPGILVLFTDFGVNPALIKYSAQYNSENKQFLIAKIIKISFIFKLLISMLILLASLPFSNLLALNILKRPQLGNIISISLFLIIGQSLLSTTSSLFIGLDRMEYSAGLSVTQSIIRGVLAPTLVIIGFGVAGAVLGLVSGSITAGSIGLIIAIGIYRKFRMIDSDDTYNFNAFKTLIKYGSPLYITSILGGLTSQYRNLILTWFTSNTEIGNYSAAIAFSALITILAYPISTALFPAFSKIDINREYENMNTLFKLSIKYISLLIIPASVFTMLFSKELIYLLYGSRYSLAPPYLILYTIIFLYTGFGYLVLANFFNGIGETKVTLKIGVINVVISLFTAPILTILFRVQGLIISILISSITSLSYGLYISKKTFRMSFDSKSSIKIYLSSLISAGITLIPLKYLSLNSHLLNIIIYGILFLILYLTIVPIVKAINIDDVRNLDGITREIKFIYPILKPFLEYVEKLV